MLGNRSVHGCPSCSSTVGPTLEGIIDTLGHITSSLTEAHGGAPGAPAVPLSAPGAAAPVSAEEQDMFPSAPVIDEEECVPFNVVSSDPECGILCWRGSEEFVDAQGELPQPREYATSDPNCTILCWDDISFEKVKQMPLAVKPPELESKGLEEGQLLTTVALEAATTEPLSVSADIKGTSGPAVSATVERSSQESFEYSEECYSRLTAEDFPFGDQGSFVLEQGKLCAFTDSELELPFEEDAESVYLDPQERLFENEFPECLSQAAMIKEYKPVQQLTTVAGEDVCICSGVCTCSSGGTSPVETEPLLGAEVPAATEIAAFDEKVSDVSPVQVAPEEPMVLGEGKVIEEKVAATPGKTVCSCSGVCTCCAQCTGIAPVKTEIPMALEKVSEESVTESLYTRISAEDFYFGDPGSFVLEPSKTCEFTDSELDLPFEEEVESVNLGSSERLFMDEFPGSANIPPLIVQPHVVLELAPVTAEIPGTTAITAFDEKVSELSPVEVTAEGPTVLGKGEIIKAGCICSGVCRCTSTASAPVEKELHLPEEKISLGSFTESLYTRTSAEDLYFGEFGSYALEGPSKICEFTESELELPFEEEVESVYLGSTERLFQDEFPGSTNIPPFIVQPHVVMELAPVTAEIPGTTVIEAFDEKVPQLSPVEVTAEGPTVPDEGEILKAGCTCSGVCICTSTESAPVEKELHLPEEKISLGSFTESLYTRTSAEDLYFGEFGSYALEGPSKICEFTDSELELPFEEEVESVYLGSTERLFQDEFPENAKLPPFSMEPVTITDVVLPQAVLEVPETTSETVPVGMITPSTGIEAPTRLETPTRLEAPTRLVAAEGYRIERATSSTGELRDEIYYDVLGRTAMEPGTEHIVAEVSYMLVEPLEAIRKMEDEIMSEIPRILSQLLAKCEGSPEGKPELSEIQHVLSEVLAKCAAVDADKQTIMENVITEVLTKGEGGLEAGDVHDILKELIGKCEGTVPGALQIPDTIMVTGGTEAPDVKAILSGVISKCGDKGKIEPFDIARILSEVITSQVAIQSRAGVPEQLVTPQVLELLPEGVIPPEQQEIKQKRVCTCASSPKYGVIKDTAVEKTEPQVLIQDTEAFVSAIEGPSAHEEHVMQVAAVSGSDASFEYNEDSYSRVTAADFPFGETGSCILEPPKEYGFTDSELELPFEEEEPIVELGPEERLFQNEFSGVVTATHKPPTITTDTAEEAFVPEEVAVTVGVPGTAEEPEGELPGTAEEREVPEETTVTGEVPVTAEEPEEETFFEAIGETLPEEKTIGEIILADEGREGEGEGDMETQLASLRHRVSNKSNAKEECFIRTLKQQMVKLRTAHARDQALQLFVTSYYLHP
ncbi:uncharacterized protein LOC126260604 [Schistocerca nitens]|uniref:uncharacterized protein LOC126260604 n=1 Tax=Schistocerca nitens TaxID=7011 RepID=UPI0021173E86|nr:uncharacterized protein LOC126260604 [Schistocerca nitens]